MSEYITKDALAHYPTVLVPNIDFHTMEPDDKTPEWGVLQLVHSKCSGNICTPMAWGPPYVDTLKQQDVIIGVDNNDLLNNIGRHFIKTQAKLETIIFKNKEPDITKDEVVNAFAPIYHILNPQHKYGQYCRELIEKSFEVLELGPIPSMKMTENVVGKRASQTDELQP